MERGSFEEIAGILRGLLIRLDDRIPAKDLALISEFIDAGEPGLALEQLADVLSEDEQPLASDERADMLELVGRMRMNDRVRAALSLCPPTVPLPEIPYETKTYVCVHVFDGSRPILYVTRPDGDWCLLCGEGHPDEANSYRVVGIGHVLDYDRSVAEVLDLRSDQEAERRAVGEPWHRSEF